MAAVPITTTTDSRQGDSGTLIELTITDAAGAVIDISSATLKEFIIQRPDGTNLTPNKSTAFVTDGTDGKIEYTTLAADLDVTGTWKVQAHLTLADGDWKTTVATFTVGALL